MTLLQNYCLKRKINSILNNATIRKSRSYSLNDARSFFISYNENDAEEAIQCVMSLTSLGKKVHICTFIPRTPSRAKYESNVSPLVIKESELSMTGMPASQLREAFNNTQADILIDLTREEDMVMHYLQLRHPAPFKVGNKSSIRDMFDLTVTKKTEDDLPTSFGHMLGFLQTIRTNERPLKD